MAHRSNSNTQYAYQAILSGAISGTCFFTYYFGLLKFYQYLSPPEGHFLGALFFYYPALFGLFAYSTSSGTHFKRIIYLLFGSIIFFSLMAIALKNGNSDPAKPGFGIMVSQGLSIMYLAGGLVTFSWELILGTVKRILNIIIKTT